MEQRGNFGTKIGVILATAGSAVGLGNIWRFPYMTGQDGGAAFILIYLVCMLFLGVPSTKKRDIASTSLPPQHRSQE